MMKERFKDYRSKLHQQYKRCMSHEEAVQSASLHVTDEDWRILCDRFSSDSFQKRSKINSDNIGKLEVNHVASLKSFVRLRHDMRDSVTGQEPGPVDFCKGTHCRQSTGSWVHPRASKIWEEMNTLRSQPTPDGTQRSEPEILRQVLGIRSGYVRGFGHGAKLMASARASSSRSIVVGDSAVHRVDNAEREVQQLRVVVDDIKDHVGYQLAMESEDSGEDTNSVIVARAIMVFVVAVEEYYRKYIFKQPAHYGDDERARPDQRLPLRFRQTQIELLTFRWYGRPDV
ncbi:uncharacterized protein LOC131245248 [Magnolia sinica]|uniref:uncharacterized protein LOC131245248 n=1 Tax=Magnolia sinica TaxID=86752 RepID=UPI00265B08A8|nr:uncharacterized protein LOC131245248 [Magnolia sinica]